MVFENKIASRVASANTPIVADVIIDLRPGFRRYVRFVISVGRGVESRRCANRRNDTGRILTLSRARDSRREWRGVQNGARGGLCYSGPRGFQDSRRTPSPRGNTVSV